MREFAAAAGEIGVGLGLADLLDRALGADLAAKRLPVDRERAPRIRRQLARPCGCRGW